MKNTDLLQDENLRKLARQIMASKNAAEILSALPALLAILPPKKEDFEA